LLLAFFRFAEPNIPGESAMQVLAFGDRLKLVGGLLGQLKGLDLSQLLKLAQALAPFLSLLGGEKLKPIIDLLLQLAPQLGAQAMDATAMAAAESDFNALAVSLAVDLAWLDGLLLLIKQAVELFLSLRK
jgi:hypothetical protein